MTKKDWFVPKAESLYIEGTRLPAIRNRVTGELESNGKWGFLWGQSSGSLSCITYSRIVESRLRGAAKRGCFSQNLKLPRSARATGEYLIQDIPKNLWKQVATLLHIRRNRVKMAERANQFPF